MAMPGIHPGGAGYQHSPGGNPGRHRNSKDRVQERFRALAVYTGAGELTPLSGVIDRWPPLEVEQKRHLRAGETVLTTWNNPGAAAHVFMRTALEPEEPSSGILIGEINAEYLWGTPAERPLPPMTELFVLDHAGEIIFSSLPELASFSEQQTSEMTATHSGYFNFRCGGRDYVASYWSIFVKYEFLSPKWILGLAEARDHVLAPMSRFKETFFLVVLLTLWVVLLLSISQIRRSLVPLEKLREGTRRIAARDFHTRVRVSSGDEFEELAQSFNSMADRLGRQFNAMETMNEIDRAILSALDTEKIVHS